MQPEEGRLVLRYAVPHTCTVPALPAAVAAPPAEVLPPTPLGARAEDTNKCKRFYPEGCASNSYVKKCRKSCHEEYPLMKYCKSYVSEDKFAELKAEFEALKLAFTGPKGKEGETGEKGDKGEKGAAGDKGAAGAIVRADAVAALKAAVARAYPLAHPLYKCAVHEVRVTTGVATFEGEL